MSVRSQKTRAAPELCCEPGCDRARSDGDGRSALHRARLGPTLRVDADVQPVRSPLPELSSTRAASKGVPLDAWSSGLRRAVRLQLLQVLPAFALAVTGRATGFGGLQMLAIFAGGVLPLVLGGAGNRAAVELSEAARTHRQRRTAALLRFTGAALIAAVPLGVFLTALTSR